MNVNVKLNFVTQADSRLEADQIRQSCNRKWPSFSFIVGDHNCVEVFGLFTPEEVQEFRDFAKELVKG